MEFNVARQPLFPAFFTLLVIAVAAVCAVPTVEPAVVEATQTLTQEVVEGIDPADLTDATTRGGLQISSLAELGRMMQQTYPLAAKCLTAFMLLWGGLCVGRLSTRYKLYGHGTCISIPIYGLMACTATLGADYLSGVLAVLMMTFAVVGCCRSNATGYTFQAIFRASFCIAILILLRPAALPLLLIPFVAVIMFRRTAREWIVSATGVLLPLAAYCYVNWGMGGDFFAPLEALTNSYLQGSPMHLFLRMPLLRLCFVALYLVFLLLSGAQFFMNIYSLTTRQRMTLYFAIAALLLTLFVAVGPAATMVDLALIASPGALLMPTFFVRARNLTALVCYLLICFTALLCVMAG